jgi:hypothetical protein
MHETSRGLVSEPGDADSERKVDGYRKQGSENESLPSTSKHDSEGQNSSSEVKQKERTCSGPILCSGVHNKSITESSRIFDR